MLAAHQFASNSARYVREGGGTTPRPLDKSHSRFARRRFAQGGLLIQMATAVLSGRVDTHGYGLPFGWHSGNVWRTFTEECARIPNVGAEQMPGFLAQVVQDRHGRAAWQLRLREEKAPLLQRIEVQGNSIKSLCQEAKDCAGVYCEQKRIFFTSDTCQYAPRMLDIND